MLKSKKTKFTKKLSPNKIKKIQPAISYVDFEVIKSVKNTKIRETDRIVISLKSSK